jgi:hypothetical protein
MLVPTEAEIKCVGDGFTILRAGDLCP